eukprot:1641550-Rhodomonas_salina.1
MPLPSQCVKVAIALVWRQPHVHSLRHRYLHVASIDVSSSLDEQACCLTVPALPCPVPGVLLAQTSGPYHRNRIGSPERGDPHRFPDALGIRCGVFGQRAAAAGLERLERVKRSNGDV